MRNILKLFSVLMVIIGSFAFGQTSNETLNQFLKSSHYEQLKKTFELTDENFDLKTYDRQELADGKVEYFKIQVNSRAKINFATFYKLKESENFEVVYEKNNLNERNEDGFFEHYDENGNFYADFIVKIAKGSTYSFKINDVGSSERLGISGTTTEKRAPCLTKTYNFIKSTCEADLTCDFMCDLVPSCHTQMMIVAAAHCIAN